MGLKISKAKEYSVLYLRNEGKSTEDISEELGLTVETVSKVLEDNPEPVQVPSKKDLSFDAQHEGTAILTKEGSSIGDEIKACPPKRADVIFRPNG